MSNENKEAVEAAVTFKLKHPIKSYNDEVHELKMRKPTGADLLHVGNPVKFAPFADPPSVEHDFKRVIQMAARLASVPSSSLEKLETDEIVSLAWAISPFFLPTL